jgi:hypothetical protein
MFRKSIKVLHEIGAIGVLGALVACVVLVATAPDQSLAEYAAVRRGIAALSKWVLVPSLLLVLVSGLAAIAANRAYIDAGWAWIKALSGIVIFEGTLMNIDGTAQRAAELATAAVATGIPGGAGGAGAAEADAALLAALLRTEWLGLWTMIALALANIVIGVWRPRLRHAAKPEAAGSVSPPAT